MEAIYMGWSDSSGMFADFDTSEEEQRGVEILLAVYDGGNYDGSAFVLLRKAGKLYTVSGGHCSCYGLEGQWELVEVTVPSLLYEISAGSLGSESYRGKDTETKIRYSEFRTELLAVLIELTNEAGKPDDYLDAWVRYALKWPAEFTAATGGE